MENIKKQAAAKIRRDAHYIIENGLRDLPNPMASFDLGRVDYVIDNFSSRLDGITRGIVDIAIEEIIPLLEIEIEKRVREKIRKQI